MLLGHEQLQSSFERVVREDALGHAYLFFGDAQVGKALFAEHLATRIERGSFALVDDPLLDRMHVVPNEKDTIGIDDVRAIKHFLWQTPLRSSRRVVIVDGAHALTPEAQGAMLKIVEDPPAHGLLIFIAHDLNVLTAPLLSRLTKIYFARMAREALASFLVREKRCSVPAAQEIATRAHGRVGRALQLLAGAPEMHDDSAALVRARILQRWEEGVVKNSTVLAWLLEREALIAQYNVNAPLQKKAVEYKG